MRADRPILHIVPSEPWGGIQELVPILAQEQTRSGADVRLLCLGRGSRIRDAAALAGLADRTRSIAGILAPLALLVQIVARRVIVHSHCEPVWASAVIAATLPSRWVSHAHVYPDDTMTWKKRLSLAIQRRFVVRHIAISHSVGRALVESGVAKSATLDVVHNGVRIEPAVSRVKKQRFSIAFVGRAVAEKGLFEFIALAGLLTDEPRFAFSVYGDGADLTAAQALATEMGLSDRIIFHGYVENIAAAWATIDVAVIFSHREPFGLVFLEAALRGAATISYDNDSGGSEVAATLRTAHRISLGDLPAAARILGALATDREATDSALSEDRETIAAHYDIATMARGVADTYVRLDIAR